MVGFLIGSWTVFGRFWERFGDLGPSKMSVSLKRGAIFEKITFFRPDSVLDGFLIDFEWFWELFWAASWDQNRIQKSIKKSFRFWIDFGRILAPKRDQEATRKRQKRSPKKQPKKMIKIIDAGNAGFARFFTSGTAVPSKPCGAAGPREQQKPYDHSTACHRARWRIM